MVVEVEVVDKSRELQPIIQKRARCCKLGSSIRSYIVAILGRDKSLDLFGGIPLIMSLNSHKLDLLL